jgi:hypothetical protein
LNQKANLALYEATAKKFFSNIQNKPSFEDLKELNEIIESDPRQIFITRQSKSTDLQIGEFVANGTQKRMFQTNQEDLVVALPTDRKCFETDFFETWTQFIIDEMKHAYWI